MKNEVRSEKQFKSIILTTMWLILNPSPVVNKIENKIKKCLC